MNKKELKKQIKDLYEALNYEIENVKEGDKIVRMIIGFAKISPIIKHKLEAKEGIREIKRRKLTNEYIKRFNSFDIHEALNIEIKEAKKKIKNFDFTTKEKNIILKEFSGEAKSFLDRYNGEVIN